MSHATDSGPARAGKSGYAWVWRILPWLIVSVGATARIYIYARNRSFWLDEVFLAEDFLVRNADDLFAPLMNGQVAPFGFVAVEVASVSLFGHSEYSLRLFPLLSGLILLLVFHRLSEVLLDRESALMSLGIVSLSSGLIYFSSEVKPYVIDAFAACLILAVAYQFFTRPTEKRRYILLGLTGVLAVWFSYPSAFVLAGLAAGMAVQWYRMRPHRQSMTPILAAIWLSWGLSLALHYWIWISRQVANRGLYEFWAEAFLPTEFWTLEPFRWLYLHVTRNLTYPVGFSLAGIGLLMLAMGVVACARRRDPLNVTLVGVLLAVLIASALHRYPVSPRLMVFSVPVVALIVGTGVQEAMSNGGRSLVSPIRILMFFGLLSITQSFVNQLQAPFRHEMRPVAHHLHEELQPGDTVYLYHRAWRVFTYYADRKAMEDIKVIYGEDNRETPAAYLTEMEPLKGRKRVWFVFSRVLSGGEGINEKSLILLWLDRHGSLTESIEVTGASAYLYNLTRPPEQSIDL